MMYVQFVLLREGSSDNGLRAHLETLLVREGADEAVGEVRGYTGTVLAKLNAFLDEEFPVHVIFVHRDADRDDFRDREREVFDAASSIAGCPPVIPVVPVTMTEAWLLTSESAIREVSGNPDGAMRIAMPPLSGVESVADPKALLKTLIAEASGLAGRQLATINNNFHSNRETLLDRLDVEGPISRLAAWQRLVDDLRAFVDRSPRTAPTP